MMTLFYTFTPEHNMIMGINIMQQGMNTNKAVDSCNTEIKPIISF
jgi:hypothetical protein